MPLFHRVGEDYLTLGLCATLWLVESVALARQLVKKRGASHITKSDLLLSLFGLYVLLNAWLRQSFTTPITYWKWCAAAAVLLLGRQLFQNKTSLFPILVMPGFVQAFVVILQVLGWMPTRSFYFPVSGTFGNPSFPATLIAVGLVTLMETIFYRFKDSGIWEKGVMMAGTLLLTLGLLLCNSRTVILAVMVCMAILAFRRHPKKTTFLIAVVVLSAVVAGLYLLRPGSADVRLLIWRASCGLFAGHPLFGSGAGSFASHYMYAQANYFTAHPDSPFVLLAGNHYQPYNELIRLLCEQGIAGTAIFLAGTVPLLIRRSAAQIPLLAVAVISLTFNVSDLFVLYLMFWMLAGYGSASSTDVWTVPSRWMMVIPSAIALTVLFLSAFRTADSEYMNDPSHQQAIPTYEAICEEGQRYQSEGKIVDAERCYELAWRMIPSRITATYLLFMLYAETDIEKAQAMGDFILNRQQLRSVNGNTLKMKKDIRIFMDANNH